MHDDLSRSGDSDWFWLVNSYLGTNHMIHSNASQQGTRGSISKFKSIFFRAHPKFL